MFQAFNIPSLFRHIKHLLLLYKHFHANFLMFQQSLLIKFSWTCFTRKKLNIFHPFRLFHNFLIYILSMVQFSISFLQRLILFLFGTLHLRDWSFHLFLCLGLLFVLILWVTEIFFFSLPVIRSSFLFPMILEGVEDLFFLTILSLAKVLLFVIRVFPVSIIPPLVTFLSIQHIRILPISLKGLLFLLIIPSLMIIEFLIPLTGPFLVSVLRSTPSPGVLSLISISCLVHIHLIQTIHHLMLISSYINRISLSGRLIQLSVIFLLIRSRRLITSISILLVTRLSTSLFVL